ncbi:cell wall-binding repeat-containing protein, partial [Slackia sp.]
MITRDTIVRTIASIALAAGVCMPVGLVFADEPAATDSANEETYRPAEITDEEVADVLSAFSDPTTLLSSEESTASSSVASGTVELAGETQYDTAAAEALYAFDSSEYVIVASGTSAVDALSATGLAGLLNCPILLCAKDYVPQA